jgi:ribonuclease J
MGYLEVPRGVLVELDKTAGIAHDKLVIVTTGAQGQPEAALARIATGRHRDIEIVPGDTVVLSSHPIPGNEQVVSAMINRLIRRGADVIYPPLANVHVSGHASQEEMKLLLHLTRPRYFIPIHGELRQLHQHARLARQIGIAPENIQIIENGQVIEFQDGQMSLSDERVPSTYVFVDGSGVGDIDPDVMREREALARDGMVMVNLTLSRDLGQVVYDPQIATHGFILPREAEDLLAETRKRAIAAASRANGNIKRDVEEAVREYIYSETRRQPMVFVSVSRMM